MRVPSLREVRPPCEYRPPPDSVAIQLEMVERARLAEPECTYTAPPSVALQPEMVESVTMRSVSAVYVAPPFCGCEERAG